jgi:glutamine amidotransferase
MNKLEVTIIDYGMGNLLSVRRGLEHCGAEVKITADPDVILSSSRVVLPGVGAFSDGMIELKRHGLNEVVLEIAKRGKPLLGICLGMQMLFDMSEEFGLNEGLGLLPGKVIPILSPSDDLKKIKIPHIGWNALNMPPGIESWKGTILEDINPGDAVYFVHSFMAKTKDQNNLRATCSYEDKIITSVGDRDNVYGCQFHPEKSGEIGLKVLRRFLKL